MVPSDFDPNFGEDKDMPSDMQEKTPGVYVRADDNELPHELDMLWSNNRPYQREDRSPLISFVVGLLLGVIITTAVFMLFIMRPQVKMNENEMTAPVSGELNGGQRTTTSNQNAATGANPTAAAGQASNTPAGVPANATSYTVVSGDSLGRISEKVYGSMDPQLMDKIQRANNMSSPDKLQINQKLIIPPKNY
jgi:LysM repeat protein